MDKYKYSYLDDKGIYCYENSDVLTSKLVIRDETLFYSNRELLDNKTSNHKI